MSLEEEKRSDERGKEEEPTRLIATKDSPKGLQVRRDVAMDADRQASGIDLGSLRLRQRWNIGRGFAGIPMLSCGVGILSTNGHE